MSVPSTEKAPFLLAQRLRELTATDANLKKALVCRTNEFAGREGERSDHDEHWQEVARGDIVRRAAESQPGDLYGLVCDAGLGKTFNMLWLLDELCNPNNRRLYGVKVPFLLRLDDAHDLGLLDDEHDRPDALLNWFTNEVVRATDPKHETRIREELRRKRAAGQLILLLDGLDHALTSAEFSTKLATLLTSEQWKRCPVWVSGRPYAFDEAWEKVFVPNTERWQFFRVERFAKAEIREYMKLEAHGNWFDTLPVGSRGLLGVPRLLKLVCRIIRDALAKSPHRPPAEVVAGLDLRTPADVYHQAYFSPGVYGKPDTYGFLVQGLKGRAERIGLRPGVEPNGKNFEGRIERAGEVIGEIAFHLHNATSNAAKPEPNTSGMPYRDVQKAVRKRLKPEEQRKADEFDRDSDLLEDMNAHHLDFLVLAESGKQGWKFQDRTTQAFFAAHWAMKYGTPEDRAAMRKWVIDKKEGKALDGFDEFWTFAAELPDSLVDRDRWLDTFASCYAAPQSITGSRGWVQWHRRMICHTFEAMKRCSSGTVESWRASFTRLKSPTEAKHRIWKEITEGFRPIAAGDCFFGADHLADPPNPGTKEHVKGFELHKYPVTNEMYELFDPAHEAERWTNDPHPLAGTTAGGDDCCPVVYVTWYDAFAYAAWCGCRLPTSKEWEHAYRAGTAFRYWFPGEDEAAVDRELLEHAWIDENSKDMTHPVGEPPV